jgi:hypothetical protein
MDNIAAAMASRLNEFVPAIVIFARFLKYLNLKATKKQISNKHQ